MLGFCEDISKLFIENVLFNFCDELFPPSFHKNNLENTHCVSVINLDKYCEAHR